MNPRVRIVLLVLAALLAGFVGNMAADVGRELYRDWQFLRLARIQAIQQQAAPSRPADEAKPTP